MFVKWWTLPPYLSVSVCSLLLRCLLKQLDDLVVASLSDQGQSGITTGVDLIMLLPRQGGFAISTWPSIEALIKGV